MPSQKEDAINVLGEEARELVEELEALRVRAKRKSRAGGSMILKADERKAALQKIAELRKRLDEIEAQLIDGDDFQRKWGNPPKPKERRVRIWDDGSGGGV